MSDTVLTHDRNTGSRSRVWFFTLNNYNEYDIDTLTQVLDTYDYVFQEEEGEGGTPHLQGVFRSKNALRFTTVKKMHDRWHIEICKNWIAAKKYCSKEKGRIGKVYRNDEDEVDDDDWDDSLAKPWQLEIMKMIDGPVPRRQVYWYWERTGGAGKSTLARHLALTRNDVLSVSGRTQDIKFAIMSMKKKPRVIIWDMSRQSKISYQAIEDIKNGCFFSSKYESGMCLYRKPHVIILSNREPDYQYLSTDRWVITDVNECEDESFLVQEKWETWDEED